MAKAKQDKAEALADDAQPVALPPADDAVAALAAKQRGSFVELPMPRGLTRFYSLQPEQAVAMRRRLAGHWKNLGELARADEQELTRDQREELAKLLACCCRETPEPPRRRPRLLFPGSKGRQGLAYGLPPGDLVRLAAAVARFNQLLH